MATKKQNDPEQQEFAEPVVEKVTEEKKFQLDELRKNCMKLFHVTSSTFAGATTDLPDGEYSLQEVNKHIKAWLEKEVK